MKNSTGGSTMCVKFYVSNDEDEKFTEMSEIFLVNILFYLL